MATPNYASTEAFAGLMELIKDAERSFLQGDRAVGDEASVVEGYRWLTEILSVAMDCYLWADTERPSMVQIVGPTRKFGGDNSDAFYNYAAIDPRRSYRISGRKGDAAYMSITVYGGPDDGRWSDRIVATLNDRDMEFGQDGSFEIALSAEPQTGNWIKLEPDAVCVVSRDYLAEPASQRQASWAIEATEEAPPPRPADADLARRIRAATNFLRELTALFPLAYEEDKLNQIEEPYPVPEVTYGWAAGDAAYAMGAFDLAEDEALVIEGRSPGCAFWNLCLWNPYLQTYDYRYERVTINGTQVEYLDDGSWRLVISAADPGIANWVATADHRRGRIWFRWFLPESVPERPATRVVKLETLRQEATRD